MDGDYYGDYYDEIPGEYPEDFPGEFPEGFPEELMDEEMLRQYLGEDEVRQFQEYAQHYQNYQADAYERISLGSLLDQCFIPTVSQAVSMVLPLLALCLIHRIAGFLKVNDSDERSEVNSYPDWFFHLSSAAFGLVAIHVFFQHSALYLVVLPVLVYVVLHASWQRIPGYYGPVTSFMTLVFMLSCELIIVDGTEWHRIRGAQIIISMKLISVGFDLDSGSLNELPDLISYLGYIFHVGTVIFGPWVRFVNYSNHKADGSMGLWFLKVVKSFVLSLLCLGMSTCLINWLILDDLGSWPSAYRDAQSFRFSHYFVCFLGELTAVISGIYAPQSSDLEQTDVRWELAVARPLHIEFPRSLVEVVTNWNLPMHYWLKTYVFKTAKPLGPFTAIILTYTASALLHGINFQLAAVLLSLGFYSYAEYMLRNRLSVIFDACIQAKRCRDCNHSYKYWHPGVLVTNLAFCVLAVFHLAYLGLMFDSSDQADQGYTMGHTLTKWGSLDFTSHWVAFGTFIFYWLI